MMGSFPLYKFYLKLTGNRAIFTESWGTPHEASLQGVGGVKMDQILQLVLNNGGSEGSEKPKWIKFSNWC